MLKYRMAWRGAAWVVAGLMLGWASGQAHADEAFEYTREYSNGTAPVGASPWLRATFVDVSSGVVQLTLEAANLTATEFVSNWMFTLDPTLDAEDLDVSLGSAVGFGLPAVVAKNNKQNGGAGYKFDLKFAFETSNSQRFTAGESLVATISSSATTLKAADFGFGTPKNNSPSLTTAAHVQSIGPGDNSGWVTTMPEPGTAALLGVAGLALCRRCRG